MKPNLTEDIEIGDYFVGIQIPGMLLQPFYANRSDVNGTQKSVEKYILKYLQYTACTPQSKFDIYALFRMLGYNWDCDPVITIFGWQSLILLISFTFVLILAINFLMNVTGPSQFDDANGVPIHVPVSD